MNPENIEELLGLRQYKDIAGVAAPAAATTIDVVAALQSFIW